MAFYSSFHVVCRIFSLLALPFNLLTRFLIFMLFPLLNLNIALVVLFYLFFLVRFEFNFIEVTTIEWQNSAVFSDLKLVKESHKKWKHVPIMENEY